MARRRHHRRSMHKSNWISKVVTPATFATAFVQQITAKDVASNPSFATMPVTQQASYLGKSLIGRIAGFQGFNFGQSFTNKWTALGAVLLGASMIAPKGLLPYKSQLKKAGSGFLLGGLIGGGLDDAVTQSQTASINYNVQMPANRGGLAASGLSA